MTGHKPQEWVTWLPLAEWWYNTNHHSAIGMSPFQALYSTPPPSINFQYARTGDTSVNTMLQKRWETQQLLKENLIKSQERMKCYSDKKRTDREFSVGDEVILKLQPYRQHSLVNRRNQKLAAKFYGPYAITERIGKVAYKLALLVGSKLHDVFYISQLKKKIGSTKVIQTTLPGMTDAGELDPQLVAIIDRKLIKRGNTPAVMVQVVWENGTAEEATWESWDKLRQKYPNFNP